MGYNLEEELLDDHEVGLFIKGLEVDKTRERKTKKRIKVNYTTQYKAHHSDSSSEDGKNFCCHQTESKSRMAREPFRQLPVYLSSSIVPTICNKKRWGVKKVWKEFCVQHTSLPSQIKDNKTYDFRQET